MRALLKLVLTVTVLSGPVAYAEKILYVGDSHSCQSFGKQILLLLTKAGHEVKMYCTPSSNAKFWIKGTNPAGHTCSKMTSAAPAPVPCAGTGMTPKFKDLLEWNPSARVIVALGTNSLGDPGFSSYHADMIEALKNSGNPCTWIAPPHLQPPRAAAGFTADDLKIKEANLARYYVNLQSVTKGTCRLADSRPATASGGQGFDTDDGVHRTEPAGAYWAGAIQNQIFPASMAPPAAGSEPVLETQSAQ